MLQSTTAYVWALAIMVVCFVLAIIISNLILFKPNNPGTTARRIWFWVLAVASALIGLTINICVSGGDDVSKAAHNSYMAAAGIAAGISLVVYIVLGFALSKMFPKSKIGTWF